MEKSHKVWYILGLAALAIVGYLALNTATVQNWKATTL